MSATAPPARARPREARWLPGSPPALSARIPRVVAWGIAAALGELAFAAAWWLPRGVPLDTMLQSVAALWLGRGAFSGGWFAAACGVLLYCHLMVPVVAVFESAARRWPRLLARPGAAAALYGVGVYVLVFDIAVPRLAVHAVAIDDPAWRLACACAYALLIGGASVAAALRPHARGG